METNRNQLIPIEKNWKQLEPIETNWNELKLIETNWTPWTPAQTASHGPAAGTPWAVQNKDRLRIFLHLKNTFRVYDDLEETNCVAQKFCEGQNNPVLTKDADCW